MKIFSLFLLTTIVVSAVPYASTSDARKLQLAILEEIIQSIKDVKASLRAEIFVQNVISPEHCTLNNFCKAGNILSAHKAEELGLKEKDWLLPRKLVAYTRNVHCKDPGSEERIKLHQFLDNINQCSQKEYSKH